MSFGLDVSSRWPAKGDRLLRPKGSWQKDIYFEEQRVARHAHIWDGYMTAGARLIDQCENDGNRAEKHELIYPILFCYRHGLEMAMKWVIGQYGRYAGIKPEDYMNHDLWKLWKACKKTILELGSDGETESLLAVQQVVKDFHDLDKGSDTFRYSEKQNGMVIRLPSQPFDLANIKDVMEGVNNLFVGADGQLDDNVQAAGW